MSSYFDSPEISRIGGKISGDTVGINIIYSFLIHWENSYYHTSGEDTLWRTGIHTSPDAVAEEVTTNWTPNPDHDIIRVGGFISSSNVPVGSGSAIYPFYIKLKAKCENSLSYFTHNFTTDRYVEGEGTDFGYTYAPTIGEDPVTNLNYERGRLSNSAILPTAIVYGVDYFYGLSVPVFETEEELNNYLETGNDGGALNPSNNALLNDPYYYDYTLYDTISGNKKILDEYAQWIKLPENYRICFHDLGNGTYELVSNSDTFDIAPYSPLIKGNIPYITVSTLNPSTFEVHELNDTFRCGLLDTNIPIFGDDYLDYLNGILSASDSKKPRRQLNKNLTGIITSATLNNMHTVYCNDMTHIYVMSKSDLQGLATILFSDGVKESLELGSWLWGNNPIDMVINCAYVPFNVTPFCNIGTQPLKFGAWTYNGELPEVTKISYEYAESIGKEYTLINEKIIGTYGDYRDYTNFSYELILPYVGCISLPVETIVDKLLTVTCTYDVSSLTMRYYIKSNNVLFNIIDVSVGMSVPLLGTDYINKSKAVINSIDNVIQSGKGVVTDVVKKDVVSGVHDVMNIAKSVNDAISKPSASVFGSFSSSLNIFDTLQSYLIITERETLKPDLLNTMYNKPSYYMGKLGKCSGFTQVSDIQLVGCDTATDSEKDTIKNLLKGGVIL